MEKVWIITIDDVCDYEKFWQRPVAFKEETEAKRVFKAFKDDIKVDYEEDLKQGYTYHEGDNFVEVYGDEYARDHYSVALTCVDLL